MAYEFQKSPVATVKINDFGGANGVVFNLPNVNGSLSSADLLVAGVSQFLGIAGMSNYFQPVKMVRVVTENVVSTE